MIGAAPRFPQRRKVALEAAAVGALAFALYAAMAARDVAFGDGPELTAAAISNGVAHPPGYPLWIVLGHLASLLPLGARPYRVNLTASFYHALVVGLTYASAYVLTRSRIPALFAAAILAVGSPLFVSWSLQAEVFSLNDLFAAAIVLLCLAWLDDPRRWRTVVALGALFGLGISNQQSLISLAPLPVWAAWCGRAELLRDRRAAVWIALALALVPLCFALPYAHTLLASQASPVWHFGSARDAAELRDLILRKAYGGLNLVARPADQGGTFVTRVATIAAAGGWPVVAMLLGLVALARARRFAQAVLGGLILLPALLFCAVANIKVDEELLRAVFARFGLLSLTAMAPFAACAFAALLALVPERARRTASVAALAAVAVACAVTLPGLSLARQHGPRNLFRDIANALPPHAILMTAGDPVDQPPSYFAQIEGWRPDVTIVTFGLTNYQPYDDALAHELVVPPGFAEVASPQARRDELAYLNRARPFYVVGERGIHAPGPYYAPSVTGVVSRLVAGNRREDLRAHYRLESALQLAPGYGDVPADPWLTNGSGTTVREYYAGGYFFAGIDAERLGDVPSALAWYERAAAYFPDPVIAQRINALESR